MTKRDDSKLNIKKLVLVVVSIFLYLLTGLPFLNTKRRLVAVCTRDRNARQFLAPLPIRQLRPTPAELAEIFQWSSNSWYSGNSSRNSSNCNSVSSNNSSNSRNNSNSNNSNSSNSSSSSSVRSPYRCSSIQSRTRRDMARRVSALVSSVDAIRPRGTWVFTWKPSSLPDRLPKRALLRKASDLFPRSFSHRVPSRTSRQR